jgi:hypothetical protein
VKENNIVKETERMKTSIKVLFALTLLLTVWLSFPTSASAVKVEVNIGIGLPVYQAPPELVVVPNSYVYVVPDQDVFFYQGYWFRPYEGRWYRARAYNGPWSFIVRDRVPVSVINLPPDYRQRVYHERIPYGQVKKNWHAWERDRYWDAHGEKGHGEGHDKYGNGHGEGHERHDNGHGEGHERHDGEHGEDHRY